jgi:hypothetical protein
MKPRMRSALFLLALALVATPARAGDAPGAFAPYEDLLQVLGDLTWHLHDDVYRFSPPRDPTGHDLYRLALARLENWEKRYPGRLRDVVTYGRAEALEHLGEYQKAADFYGQVATQGSPLANEARTARERVTVFAEAAALPEEGADVDATLAALRTKLDAWGKVVDRYQSTPYEPVALVEEERLEGATAALVVHNRRALQNGDLTAEKALRFLISKHADSRNLAGHIMDLGDFYADVAREYVAAHARVLAFDEDEFDRRADRALDTYRKVATWDGAREKPEAQGRFTAFDAYKTSILARYR